MPNWHDVLNELNRDQQKLVTKAQGVLDAVRRKYLKQLSARTGRNTIAYYSAFLSKSNVDGIDITSMLCAKHSTLESDASGST